MNGMQHMSVRYKFVDAHLYHSRQSFNIHIWY